MIQSRLPRFSLALFVFLTAAGCQCAAKPPSKPASVADSTTHYRIEAQIRPETGRFDVSVDMHFVPEAPRDTLRFLLHEDLEIEELRSPAIGEYTTAPWRYGGRDTVHTKVVTVPLARKAAPSDPLSLKWNYEGQLRQDRLAALGGAVVSPHWMELPLESMWMPVGASLRQRFTFDAEVALPEGYTLVSRGPTEKTSAGWHVQSRIPGPDVPLIISDKMRQLKRSGEGPPVSVYHAGAPDSMVTFVVDRAAEILARYDRRFGDGRQADSLRITLAPLPRARPGSYARPGLIAVEHGVEPGKSLYRLLAHEAAHIWWIDSVDPLSRHNFLNESFAEYESWLAIREAYGKKAFQSELASARSVASDTLSFSEWTPELNGPLSYNKGPLLLHKLRERIAEPAYLKFLRRLQRKEVGTLERMVATLGEVTDPATAEWFGRQL